jgi:hypothetical protein
MKRLNIYFSAALMILILAACSDSYKVENFKEETNKNLTPILPYISKLEHGVNYDNRFDTANAAYFQEQLKQLQFSFERYFIAPDSTHYFLIWKKAPSLYEKKIAIGGRFKKDKNGKIYAFEELFNTPKMKLDELKEKSFPLFDYMVKNGNVDKYVGDYLLIEFPDERCVYDKKGNRWVFVNQLNKADTLSTKQKDSSTTN